MCWRDRHALEGAVDLGVGYLQPINFGATDFESVVDQIVNDFLARRRLVGGNRDKLCALLNVEFGDRRTIRDDNDLRLRD